MQHTNRHEAINAFFNPSTIGRVRSPQWKRLKRKTTAELVAMFQRTERDMPPGWCFATHDKHEHYRPINHIFTPLRGRIMDELERRHGRVFWRSFIDQREDVSIFLNLPDRNCKA